MLLVGCLFGRFGLGFLLWLLFFLPAFARRMRFRNCVAASVVPETLILASVIVSIPSRRVHFSRSSSWTFGGAGSNVSHSLVMVSVVHVVMVVPSGFFPHWHGHA